MRYAQVINGTVVNVILWDGATPLGLDGELVNVDDVPCGLGWTYANGGFVPPPAPDIDDEV